MPELNTLIEQLRCASTPNDAVEAIQSLVKSGTPSSIAPLIEVLSHHHPPVAAAAVAGLVQLAPDSVEPLIAAYQASTDQGLQAYIIQALAQIGDSRALDLLAQVVGVEVANHCQGSVRRVAARGLGQIGSRCRDPVLIHRAVEKLTWALHNADDWGLRYAAVVSLQEIATPEAIAAGKHALTQEPDKAVQARLKTALEQLSANA